MKKMKLVNALKVKNRIAGEVTRLSGIIKRENSKVIGSTSAVDMKAVSDEYKDSIEKLINIKAAIAKANADIYEKIDRMSEYKSLIKFYIELDTKDGRYRISGDYGKDSYVEEYKAFYKQEDIDRMVKDLRLKIEALQDEIDEFNAVKFIEIEL